MNLLKHTPVTSREKSENTMREQSFQVKNVHDPNELLQNDPRNHGEHAMEVDEPVQRNFGADAENKRGNSALLHAVIEVQQLFDTRKKRIANLDEKMTLIKDDLQRARDAHIEAYKTLDEVQTRDFKVALRELEDKNRFLCEENRFLREQNERLSEEISGVLEQRDQQNQEMRDLKGAMRDLRIQIEEVGRLGLSQAEQIAKQSRQIAHMNEVIEEFRAHNDLLIESNRELRSQLEAKQEDETRAALTSLMEERVALGENPEEAHPHPPEEQRDAAENRPSFWRRCVRDVLLPACRLGVCVVVFSVVGHVVDSIL